MEPQTKSNEGNTLKPKDNNKKVFLWGALYPLGSSCPTLPCWKGLSSLVSSQCSGSIWQPLV